MIRQQDRIHGLTKEILGDRYIHLEVLHCQFQEDFRGEDSLLACRVRTAEGETTIEGHGVGIVDAFFKGLLIRLSRDYPSLKTVSIDKFTVQAKASSGRQSSMADSLAVVTVGMSNSVGRHFEFQHESRSVTRSSIEATLLAVEYFVNSECAFIECFRAMKSAKEQRRQDLVERYTSLMSELVKNTSYSEVIEQIREEMRQ